MLEVIVRATTGSPAKRAGRAAWLAERVLVGLDAAQVPPRTATPPDIPVLYAHHLHMLVQRQRRARPHAVVPPIVHNPDVQPHVRPEPVEAVAKRERGVRAERLAVGGGMAGVGEDGDAHVRRDAELRVCGAQPRADEARHVLEVRVVRERQPEDLLEGQSEVGGWGGRRAPCPGRRRTWSS